MTVSRARHQKLLCVDSTSRWLHVSRHFILTISSHWFPAHVTGLVVYIVSRALSVKVCHACNRFLLLLVLVACLMVFRVFNQFLCFLALVNGFIVYRAFHQFKVLPRLSLIRGFPRFSPSPWFPALVFTLWFPALSLVVARSPVLLNLSSAACS